MPYDLMHASFAVVSRLLQSGVQRSREGRLATMTNSFDGERGSVDPPFPTFVRSDLRPEQSVGYSFSLRRAAGQLTACRRQAMCLAASAHCAGHLISCSTASGSGSPLKSQQPVLWH